MKTTDMTSDSCEILAEDNLEATLEEIALTRGKTPNELIAEFDKQIETEMSSNRHQCLKPDDLVEYKTSGKLPPAFEVHRQNCLFCSQLLQAVVPTPTRIRQLRNEVKEASRLQETLRRLGALSNGVDWRIVVATMAMITVVILGALDSSLSNSPRDILIAASPESENSTAAPVTIRLQALQPTSITVTEADVTLAAATAALSSNPPTFTVPPYGVSDRDRESVLRVATEQTAAFCARILPSWQRTSESDRSKLVADLAKQLKAISKTPELNENTGTIRMSLMVKNRSVGTEFNLVKTMDYADRQEALISQKWSNVKLAAAKPIQLENGISLRVVHD